jgi:hypothetical protein
LCLDWILIVGCRQFEQVVLTLADFVIDCTGVVTFTATATGGVPPHTFRWTVDDVVQADTDTEFSVGPFGDTAVALE